MTQAAQAVNSPPDGDFCDTPTARRIFDVLTYCRDFSDIGLIFGEPGAGKSTAIKRYALINRGVKVCTMSPALTSMSATLGMICESYGVYPNRRIADGYRMLIDRIDWHCAESILILDEAQLLNDLTIDALRCIYDETGMAMVFCGNASFRTRFNNSRAASFAQFTSRVGARLEIAQPTEADIAAICNHHGVTAAGAITFLTQHARSSGGLRVVNKLITMAEVIAGESKPVGAEHVRSAAKVMGVSS